MRILIYTDTHFSQYSSIVRNRGSKYSIRLENLIKSINWVEDLADQEDCDLIVCLGDFFDKPELSAEELTALREIHWSTIPHKFLVGNHEISSSDSIYNSVNALSKIGMIIDKPIIEEGFGYRILYLPYILESNRKTIKEYYEDILKDTLSTQEVKNDIIFSHNDICGIRYGQYESKIGFNVKDISNHCNLFINGHLHNQQQVNEKILNLGNLTGQNFSEDAEKYSHCAAILDTDTLQIELINNPVALNFYKLEILDETNLSKLNVCKDYSVISIKTYQSLVNKIKEILSDKANIICYRIVTIPELKENTQESIDQILKLDHIDQFRQYIRENLDNTELLEDELSYIK